MCVIMIAMMMIMKQYDILIVGIQPPIFEAGLFTHSQAEHVLVSSANFPRLPSFSKKEYARNKFQEHEYWCILVLKET